MSDINVTVQDEIVNIDVLDTPVLVNVVNSPGQQGPAGPGVPVGGTEGQILAKVSATNYDTAWINNYAKYLATNVRNQTGSTIGAFQVVYISGATGNKPLISLADADTEATSSKTYGITATAIPNNGTGDVVTAGELSGINTSAFNEGDLLWLSTIAGGVVTSPPAEPAHAVFIGYVVRSHPTLGTIDVSIQNGYELNELHGVQITTPTDNQGLFYNSTSLLWENKTISTVLGYTPEQPLTFNSPLSRSVNAVSIPQATGSVNGFLSATDWTTFNSKQNALGFTPANAATTLTINGVTYDLSANRSWTVAAGISGSGASGQVTYWTGASAVSGSNNLFWDNTNSWLGIGTNTYTANTTVSISENFTAATSVGLRVKGVGSSTGIWKGRVVAGGDNVAFLMGEYNSQAWLGGHNAALNAWAPLYINPDGTTDLYLGDSTGGSGGGNTLTPILTVRNQTGNAIIGTYSSDAGQRLQVYGDTLLRGSGNTSATTALTVQNSSSTNILTARNDGPVFIHAVNSVATLYMSANGDSRFEKSTSGTNGIQLYGPTSAHHTLSISSFSSDNYSNGALSSLRFNGNYVSSAGSTAFSYMLINGTINQTGSTSITRGLYVNPTLTSAANFRAIETARGNIVFGNLPTSSAGLPTGALWNDAGTVKIV